MAPCKRGANKGKRKVAVQAKEEGIDYAHNFIDESSRGEDRHAQALEDLLQHYFK
ncbi:hypothetical protein [Calderihabitans maritimus]|uniref:hypothetical protein n=1 Tax=Calderihabitans maritimus TaxID=1246530 RepID=UPI001863A2C6|nr:hypothetical protein [Calderihabitans maritimus]